MGQDGHVHVQQVASALPAGVVLAPDAALCGTTIFSKTLRPG
jgi:hypothetical protein